MITTLKGVNAEIQARYLNLFDEASKLLSGTINKETEEPYLKPSYGPTEVTPDNYVPNYYFIKNEDGEYILADGAFIPDAEYFTEVSSINTLEEYFCHIADLHTVAGPSKFLMLPLDEEMFEIDANTRSIMVPASFRRNGVGVKGDKAAEILLFRINRFFDYVDFSNCQIWIQWQDPSGKQKVTQVDLIDIDTYVDDGKMVFGWMLSEAVAAQVGDIKFAIRIIKTNDADPMLIDYSFGTLPATIKISDSLAFNPAGADVEPDATAGDIFINTVVNSENTMIPQAKQPILAEVLPAVALAEDLDNDGTYELKLKMNADVEDAGNLMYRWWFKEDEASPRVYLGNEDAAAFPSANHTVEKEFIEVAAEDLKPGKNYFYEVGEGAMARYFGELDASDRPKLFIRNSIMTAFGTYPDDTVIEDVESPITGGYYVEVVNNLSGRQKTSKSTAVQVLDPVVPVINVQPKDDIGDNITLEMQIDNNDADLAYQWRYAVTEGGLKEPDVTVTDFVKADDTNPFKNIHIASEAGYYQGVVRARKNLGQVIAETDVARVVKMPVAPVFVEEDRANIVDGAEVNIEEINVRGGGKVIEPRLDDATKSMIDDPLKSDKFIYEWYYDNNESTDEDGFSTEKLALISDGDVRFDGPSISLPDNAEFAAKYDKLRLKVTNVLTGGDKVEKKTSDFSKLYVIYRA